MMSSTDLPKAWIIVLNWNNPGDTLACLESLQRVDYASHSVLVVDNGSTDNSVSAIRKRYPDVCLLETGENLGYAGGNNVGIRRALQQGAEYVCILNNDVVVAPGFLGFLLSALESAADVGVVTPLVLDTGTPGCVWALGARVGRRTANVDRLYAGADPETVIGREPFEVDAASGSAFLVSRGVLEEVGLLDENYFLYFEEIDWCLTVRRAGYRILAVPRSRVWHKVSATLGEKSALIDYYMLRNHLHVVLRHWTGLSRVGIIGRIVFRNLLTVVAYTLNPQRGHRTANRNARLLALRDVVKGQWGKMGADSELLCRQARR